MGKWADDPPCGGEAGMGRWQTPQAADGGAAVADGGCTAAPSPPSLRLGGPPPHSASRNGEDLNYEFLSARTAASVFETCSAQLRSEWTIVIRPSGAITYDVRLVMLSLR